MERTATVATAHWYRPVVDAYRTHLLLPVIARMDYCALTPNHVTILRVLPAIAACYALASGDATAAGWLFIVSCIGDHLDGELARYQDAALVVKGGQPWWYVRGSSESGKFLDPTIDKAANLSVLYALGLDPGSGLYGIAVSMTVMECTLFCIAAMKYAIVKGWLPAAQPPVTGANAWGKAKMMLQIFGICSLLLLPESIAAASGMTLLVLSLPASVGSIIRHVRP